MSREPSFRPKFSIAEAKILFRAVQSYRTEDMHEAILLTRLTASIRTFVISNDAESLERTNKLLETDTLSKAEIDSVNAEIDRLLAAGGKGV